MDYSSQCGNFYLNIQMDMKPGDWIYRRQWPETPKKQYSWQFPDQKYVKFLLIGIEGDKGYIVGPDNYEQEINHADWAVSTPRPGDTLEQVIYGRKGVIEKVCPDGDTLKFKVRWDDGEISEVHQGWCIPLNTSAMRKKIDRINRT